LDLNARPVLVTYKALFGIFDLGFFLIGSFIVSEKSSPMNAIAILGEAGT
jgi:hypothetical protein